MSIYAMCTSKVRYRSNQKALRAAIRLSKLAPHRAYECPHCKGWHLTVHRAFTPPTTQETL